MALVDLKYGQKVLVAYTGLDGLEKAKIVLAHQLQTISRTKKKKFFFKKTFPFFEIKEIEFTDLLFNIGSDIIPKWRHIYALESPRLMAKKFGIYYADINVEKIDDDLEG